MKLEAIEDDKILLANALAEESGKHYIPPSTIPSQDSFCPDADDASSEVDSDTSYSDSDVDELQEDVKPIIAVKEEGEVDGDFESVDSLHI